MTFGLMNEILYDNAVKWAMQSATNGAAIVSGTYNSKKDKPKPTEWIKERLYSVRILCDVLMWVKEGEKAEEFDKIFKDGLAIRLLTGFERCYTSKDEREFILNNIERHRKPYDQIAKGEDINLEELANAGDFFGKMNERTDRLLPLRLLPSLPEGFGRPRR